MVVRCYLQEERAEGANRLAYLIPASPEALGERVFARGLAPLLLSKESSCLSSVRGVCCVQGRGARLGYSLHQTR